MKHDYLFLDFETYYDADYSLKKLTPAEYILDPRYETIMCAVKVNNEPTFIVDGPDFEAFLEGYPAKTTTTVTFNALFDNSILAWRYGYVPRHMLCSMSMARALLGHQLASFSLESVAAHLKLGAKGGALASMKGKRRMEIYGAGLWPSFCEYAINDNELNYGIFKKLIRAFPADEQVLMDMTLRTCIEPQFDADTELLESQLLAVRESKDALLAECGVSVDDLMSADKFKVALEQVGVEVEMKTSPTGRRVPAFARTDKFMADLGEHEDVRVQSLAAARLGHKSTLEETRTQKFLTVARLPWANTVGNMPMPLRYGGAHTHRLSGDWGMNVQNLPTARSSGGKSRLRAALRAPTGHTVVAGDLGQIEARLVAWVCGATTLLDQFANKEDPYALLATAIFKRPIVRKRDVVEGFIGKTGILGLGYGCGKEKFDAMVRQGARGAGIDIGAIYDRGIGDTTVDTYRQVHSAIPSAWRRLDRALSTSWLDKEPRATPFGPVIISRGSVELPSKLHLSYAEPQLVSDAVDENDESPGQEYRFRYGRMTSKIYGAKLLENIVQALARIVVMDAALRVYRRTGLRFVLQAHDEVVYIIKNQTVDNFKLILMAELTRPPKWAPDLPLTADIGSGANYGECK